jgi:hypothetical protein
MKRNLGCTGRLFEELMVQDLSLAVGWDRGYELVIGFEAKVFGDFSIHGDILHSYQASPPFKSRQVKWVAPPTVTSPSINGVPFPLIDKVQPILSRMPVEIMDNILTRSSELVQFEDYEFWLGPKRNVSLSGIENEYEHAYIGELRL